MALASGSWESVWFLDTRVQVHAEHTAAADGLSLAESMAPYGDSPSLHVHHREDELFYVLEGTFRFKVGDGETVRGAGEALLIPRWVAHTYLVESPQGGRWLVVTSHGDFERLVRAVCRPAAQPGLPPQAGPPSPEQVEALSAAALAELIEIIGPPLH